MSKCIRIDLSRGIAIVELATAPKMTTLHDDSPMFAKHTEPSKCIGRKEDRWASRLASECARRQASSGRVTTCNKLGNVAVIVPDWRPSTSLGRSIWRALVA